MGRRNYNIRWSLANGWTMCSMHNGYYKYREGALILLVRKYDIQKHFWISCHYRSDPIQVKCYMYDRVFELLEEGADGICLECLFDMKNK